MGRSSPTRPPRGQPADRPPQHRRGGREGDELAREAHAKLAALDPHFVGNVEPHDLIEHRVTSSCATIRRQRGDQVLRGHHQLDLPRPARDLQQDRSRRCHAGVEAGFDRMRARFDYERYGGAPLLGVKGVSIVTHGRARARLSSTRSGRVRVRPRSRSGAHRAVDARAPALVDRGVRSRIAARLHRERR